MGELKYVPVPRRTREAVLRMLDGSPKEIADALLSAAYWDADPKWVQEQLVRFASHADQQVLWTVASGLGLLAVFHGELELEVVEPILRRLEASGLPAVAAAAEDARDDINHFIVRRRAGERIPLGERLEE
jgi:hypothetical protein